MDKRLLKKLKAYTGVAGSIAVSASTAQGQIVYTDIFPDAVVTDGNQFYIDMNNDNVNDLFIGVNIMTSEGSYKRVTAYPLGSLELLGSTSSLYGNYVPYALSYGQSIGSSPAWAMSSSMDLGQFFVYYGSGTSYPVSLGNWFGASNKYLGVKMDIGGNTHYGWIRMTVSADLQTVTIKDYALGEIPDVAISAGDKGLASVNEAFIEDNVIVKTTGNSITIIKSDNLGDATVTVRNTLGQNITSVSLGNETTIDVNDTGVLLVSIQHEGAVLTKKVLIQ